jgi:hypothetical protein
MILCITQISPLTAQAVDTVLECQTLTGGAGFVAMPSNGSLLISAADIGEYYLAGFTVMAVGMLIAFGFKQLIKPFIKTW